MQNRERSLHAVPRLVWLALVMGLLLQLTWHNLLVANRLEVQALPEPPSLEMLHTLSLGDNIATARLLMLWLQSFDSQAGHFVRYDQLDYAHLTAWLARILQLDPQSQYPLLAASHVYSHVQDAERQQLILEFIYTQYHHDPAQRWQWLAHAAIIARHRLKNLHLALKYAQAVARHATPDMPYWAQTMQVFILEEMGELERARLVVGGLLNSGHINDPNEIKFLNAKLLALEGQ